MLLYRMFVVAFLVAAVSANDEEALEGFEKVTCGSAVQLEHLPTHFRLNSQEVQYGTGSGQQSVTLHSETDKSSALWKVLASDGKQCKRGTKIKCGAVVRLQHVRTRKYLHSHKYASPLSQNQEVSAFANAQGDSDQGDNWKVDCEGTFWERDSIVTLKHKETGMYLASDGKHKFGQPISGHREVCGMAQAGNTAKWQTKEGIFIAPPKKRVVEESS